MKKHYIPEEKFPIKLDENIYILGNYFFNLFLVAGEKKSALFEVGISAVVDQVIKQMENLGIIPDFIIPSHPHSDHITGLPGLAGKYPAAEIVAAKGAKEFIKHPKAAEVMFREERFMSQSLAQYDITPGRPPLEIIPDLDHALVVDEKLSLDLGGITLDLIKVEGHSPGNLIGLINSGKIVFSSDSIGFHYPCRGFFPLFFTGADPYLATFKLIKELNPSIICPAHQGPLEGRNAVKALQDSFDITVNTIKMVKASSKPDKTLADQLFKKGYVDEFTLYTRENIQNCCSLIVKRSKESSIN